MATIDRRGLTVGEDTPAASSSEPSANLAIKTPVRVATTVNITRNGIQSIDGVTVAVDNRVLVKNQTSSVDNGIYVVSSGNWVRSTDFDTVDDVVNGALVYVNEGSINGAEVFVVTASDPITPDVTSLTFTTLDASLGAATAISINKVIITPPASSATLTIPNGVTMTGPAASGTVMTIGNVETVTGAKTFSKPLTVASGILNIATLGNTAFPKAFVINDQGDICLGADPVVDPSFPHHLSFEIIRNCAADAAMTIRNRNDGTSARAVWHGFAGTADQTDASISVSQPGHGSGASVNWRAGGTNSGFNLIQSSNDIMAFFTNNVQVAHIRATGELQLDSANSIAANGAVATTMTSVGPTGSHTTVQKWWKIYDASGVPFYIPLY